MPGSFVGKSWQDFVGEVCRRETKCTASALLVLRQGSRGLQFSVSCATASVQHLSSTGDRQWFWFLAGQGDSTGRLKEGHVMKRIPLKLRR